MSTTTLDALYRFIGGYGTNYKRGLLSEHVNAFLLAGGEVRPAVSGSGLFWAVVDGEAVPVVCSELIPWANEDGPIAIRCGLPAVDGLCEGHALDVAEWLAMDESERIAWERARG